jgi:hypothetical protein
MKRNGPEEWTGQKKEKKRKKKEKKRSKKPIYHGIPSIAPAPTRCRPI